MKASRKSPRRSSLYLFMRESSILEVTEHICELMEQKNISRSDLAKMMGCTPAFISQCLDGQSNLTIKTLSDILTTLNVRLIIQTKRLQKKRLKFVA